MKNVIAIEFGGQSVKAAVVDLNGNVHSYRRITLNQDSPPSYARFEQDFEALLRSTIGEINLLAAGIAHPNPCDPQTITFSLAQKPAYKYINHHALLSVIRASTGLSECYPINDARAAGLGELWQGKIEARGRFLLLTLGTGLGAVFIEDGFIVTGKQVEGIPESGELWDYPYQGTNLENTTGTTKSAVGVYRKLGGTDPEILGGDLKKLAALCRENQEDSIPRKTFAEFGWRLGDSLAPIVTIFHPETIILSGNIALAYDLFEPAASQALMNKLERSGGRTKILKSDLIDRGGLLGAAFRAFYPDRPVR